MGVLLCSLQQGRGGAGNAETCKLHIVVSVIEVDPYRYITQVGSCLYVVVVARALDNGTPIGVGSWVFDPGIGVPEYIRATINKVIGS